MTNEYFMKQIYIPEFRQYVIDLARSFTKNKELREDCCQEAWIEVSKLPEDKTIGYYRNAVGRAMERCKKREQRYFRRQSEIKRIMGERLRAGKSLYDRKKVRIIVKKRA